MATTQFSSLIEVARILGQKGIDPGITSDGVVFKMHIGGKIRYCRIDISRDGAPALRVIFGEVKIHYGRLLHDLHYQPGFGDGLFAIKEDIFTWWHCLDMDPDAYELWAFMEDLFAIAHRELYAAYPLIELMLAECSADMIRRQFDLCTRMPLGSRH